MSKYYNPRPTRRNECGDCRACCTTMGVPEIQKGAWHTCQHLCEYGCRVYAERPKSCADFECLWLQGCFGDRVDERPDRLGVVFSVCGPGSPVGRFLMALETAPGSSRSERCNYLLTKVAEDVPVCVADQEGRREFRGPKAAIDAVNRVLARHRDPIRDGSDT